MKEKLAQSLFDHIPVGVGSQGIIPTTTEGLEAALEMGMDWYATPCFARAPPMCADALRPIARLRDSTRKPRSLREGYAWAEDKEHCEEYGRMLSANANKVRRPPRPPSRLMFRVTYTERAESFDSGILALVQTGYPELMHLSTGERFVAAGFGASEEARAAANGHPWRREPLRRDPGNSRINAASAQPPRETFFFSVKKH